MHPVPYLSGMIPATRFSEQLRSSAQQHASEGRYAEALEELAEPLHEDLYARQDFGILDTWPWEEQLVLSLDYVKNQVRQGGFIQFIQNGYISLLLPMPAWLQRIGADGMAQLLDDVLKVYVLNMETLDRETTVEEFAQLYEEFREFEAIDERFNAHFNDTVARILAVLA